MGAAGGYRYVRILIRYGCRRDLSVALLAHELQHALEIAGAAEIVDAESMAAFYRRTGMRTCPDAAFECYETENARKIGEIVLVELGKTDRAIGTAHLRPPEPARCPTTTSRIPATPF